MDYRPSIIHQSPTRQALGFLNIVSNLWTAADAGTTEQIAQKVNMDNNGKEKQQNIQQVQHNMGNNEAYL